MIERLREGSSDPTLYLNDNLEKQVKANFIPLGGTIIVMDKQLTINNIGTMIPNSKLPNSHQVEELSLA